MVYNTIRSVSKWGLDSDILLRLKPQASSVYRPEGLTAYSSWFDDLTCPRVYGGSRGGISAGVTLGSSSSCEYVLCSVHVPIHLDQLRPGYYSLVAEHADEGVPWMITDERHLFISLESP